MKSTPITDISIILKPSKFENLGNFVTNLIRWLKRRHKNIYFLDTERKRLEKVLSKKSFGQIQFVKAPFLFNKTQLVISIGGDGTLLGVCRNVNSKIPVFGINLGRLGFITEFNKNEFYESLNIILQDKFDSIKKSLFTLEVHKKNGKVIKGSFFNDAVISKNDIARMFTVSVEAENQHVYNLSGDGLIVSSTYGSTAYSLAAGGPIVHPEVKALLLTPICAHSLNHRPMVIPDNFGVKINLIERIKTVSITLDGQVQIDLDHSDIIVIRKNTRKSVTLVKNIDRTYFHTLKEKFIHGKRTF